MTIASINIKNVKGIRDKTFELNITPNRPSILVAPNGFGKSSIATAFASLRSTRIELREDHFFEGDQNNVPQMIVKYRKSDNTFLNLSADSNSNSISNEFSCFVINSQIKAKGIGRNFGGRNVVTASLDIEPVTLIETIPEQVTFDYTFSVQKNDFGSNGKVLPNISSLFDNLKLIDKISNSYSALDNLLLQRNQNKIIKFIKNVNLQNGTKEQLHTWMLESQIDYLMSIESFRQIAEIIKERDTSYTLTQAILAAIQIMKIYQSDKTKFKKACNYSNYKLEKDSYNTLLAAFNTTWKEIKPEKSGRSLVVNFPKAHHVSNGQRDILSFISLIIRARKKLNKEKCILIIDEVFDYLDDANLISAQYYVTQLISDFKATGKEFYPLILTHLNPRYFKNYAFSKQKVYYLDKRDGGCVNQHFIKLLQKREDTSIKDDVSRYLLHFNTKNINKRNEFQALGLKPSWGEGVGFVEFVNIEMNKFLTENLDHDPLAVCCGVRRRIEEIIFSKLTDPETKRKFFEEQNGTKNKLTFAEECGVIVPEYFYLLGIIYNDGMHWRENQDNVSPIAAKLENVTIKNLIADIFNYIC